MAFRVGSQIARNLAYDPHTGGHHHAAEHVTGVSGPIQAPIVEQKEHDEDSLGKEVSHQSHSDAEKGVDVPLSAAASQILGVAILEFGVIFRECNERRSTVFPFHFR